MRNTAFRFAVLLLAFTVTPATARKWTDSSGKHTIEAELVKSAGNEVTLKKSTDGRIIKLRVNQLSDADQRYVKSLAANPEVVCSGTIVSVDSKSGSLTIAPQNPALAQHTFKISAEDQIFLDANEATLNSLKAQQPITVFTVGQQLTLRVGTGSRQLRLTSAAKTAAPKAGKNVKRQDANSEVVDWAVCLVAAKAVPLMALQAFWKPFPRISRR